ncbi:MAG: helix-turn-helix domain-containing protein [Ktedonobacterales bacterium]|nr:helix-turn-helix domain-containing protein [Ktedonobacterales bacterium]
MDTPLMEAAQLLGIHYKRIQRAVHDGKIADRRPRPLPTDPHKRGVKYYLVNLEEVRAYGEAQGWLIDQPPINETATMILRLIQENERLQREIEATHKKPTTSRASVWEELASVSAQAVVSTHVQAIPAPAPIPQRPPLELTPRERSGKKSGRWADYERITDYPELPADSPLIPLSILCRAHGVAMSTATKQHEKGVYLVEPQRYKFGRNADVIVVNPEQVWKALQYWWIRGQMREDLAGNCGIINCPCLHLITDIRDQYGIDRAPNYRTRQEPLKSDDVT